MITDFDALVVDTCGGTAYLEISGVEVTADDSIEGPWQVTYSQPFALPPGFDEWLDQHIEHCSEAAYERQGVRS